MNATIEAPLFAEPSAPSQEALSWLVENVADATVAWPTDTIYNGGATAVSFVDLNELFAQREAMGIPHIPISRARLEATRIVDPRTGLWARSGMVADIRVKFKHALKLEEQYVTGYAISHHPDAPPNERYTITRYDPTVTPELFGSTRLNLDKYVGTMRQGMAVRLAEARRELDLPQVSAEEVEALNLALLIRTKWSDREAIAFSTGSTLRWRLFER